MEIRLANLLDLDMIMEIYAYAREQMKRNGNAAQWGDDKPAPEIIRQDIARRQLYLVCDSGMPCGVFAYLQGPDPTYKVIYDGAWQNDAPYGVIHRVASNGAVRGIMTQILNFCEHGARNIRVDTHADNHIMQHILEKSGYQKCGQIHLADGAPRIAYHKIIS